MPNLDDEPFQRTETSRHVSVANGRAAADQQALESLMALIRNTEEGVIVCGELLNEDVKRHILSLSETTGYPILADPLSNLRNGGHSKESVIDSYDSLLKDEELKGLLMPKLVIRFGPMPAFKTAVPAIKTTSGNRTNHRRSRWRLARPDTSRQLYAPLYRAGIRRSRGCFNF